MQLIRVGSVIQHFRISMTGCMLSVCSLFALRTVFADARDLSTPSITTDTTSDLKLDPANALQLDTTTPSATRSASKPMRRLLKSNREVQRRIAAAPVVHDLTGAETPELKLLRQAELELFANIGAAPSLESTWPQNLAVAPKGPLSLGGSGGLPPGPSPMPKADWSMNEAQSTGKSLDWLSQLKMPDLPMRWDAHVVRYLEFFRDDARGQRMLSFWYRRSGRYRMLIQEQLRARFMPEDLMWVAMVESGFDPSIQSPAGALGLWQFMPESARAYGLTVDRWVDMRRSPIRATEAAASFLTDLKKRFGSWELALAAYNMGYGGLLSVVKRFNSNDFWQLAKYENGLPWETTLYIPKILAIATAMRNPDIFGLTNIDADVSLYGEQVDVPAGIEFRTLAQHAGCTVKELETLNPELRTGRTPPIDSKNTSDLYTIVVPHGKASLLREALPTLLAKTPSMERYLVRFGETLDHIAQARKISKSKLMQINSISNGEVIRGGTMLWVPKGGIPNSTPYVFKESTASKPVVFVSPMQFTYPDRKRVFYRVIVGDTALDIAQAFGVRVDELKLWNSLDPNARLQEGMTLQIFVPKQQELAHIVAIKEAELVAVGSDSFYEREESQKGRKRITVFANQGDTLSKIGKKYGLSPGSMERINRRSRADVLKKGEPVLVYVANKSFLKLTRGF